MEDHPWPKNCGCGAVWSREAWSRLPYLARWELEGGPTHELRHCHCHTTLAVDVAALEGADAGARRPQHDTLAALLAEKKDELLRTWTRRVLANPADDAGHTEPALQEDVPVFIDELIATLLDDGADSRRLRIMATKRGRTQREGVLARTLRATLREWAEFRGALLELCDRANVVLEPTRARLVHRAIDEAASRSVVQLQESLP